MARAATPKKEREPERASDFARQAVSEWGEAIRHATAALRSGDRAPLTQRLLPHRNGGDHNEDGGGGGRTTVADRLGHAMEAVTSKLTPAEDEPESDPEA